jgi:hypothetical protein
LRRIYEYAVRKEEMTGVWRELYICNEWHYALWFVSLNIIRWISWVENITYQ